MGHLEAWGQDLWYNVLLCNKKFHQLSSFDCVGFSVLLINLAKNWCVKLIFFQTGSDILNPGKKFFFDFKLALLCYAKLAKIKAELSSQMCGSTVI